MTKRMQGMAAAMAVLVVAGLSACGGGGGGDNPEATPSATLVKQSTWTEHKVDNQGKPVDVTYTAVVTTNADGSYDITRTMPGGALPALDGLNINVNNVESYTANGVSTRIVYKQGSKPVTCTFDASNTPVAFPLTPGTTWSRSWHRTCDSGVNWTVNVSNGSVVGLETLTLGGVTYTAAHARFTQAETSDAPNTVATLRNHDCWYDTTSNRMLKCQFTTQAGKLSAGSTVTTATYIDSNVETLQSATFDMSARNAPKVGVTGQYQRAVVDNSNNTIKLSYTNAVTQVATDGSYVTTSTTKGGSVPKVNGTDYTVNTTNVHAANGAVLSSTSGGTTCSFTSSPQNIVGHLAVGLTWGKTWGVQCGSATFTDTVTKGVVVGAEPITVLAGTFDAFKVQYTLDHVPTSAGGVSTETAYTCWIDRVSNNMLKCDGVITHPGMTTPPTNGYATQGSDELQSLQ
jgi:hypothetical protein